VNEPTLRSPTEKQMSAIERSEVGAGQFRRPGEVVDAERVEVAGVGEVASAQ
jgi:hypothetical protein